MSRAALSVLTVTFLSLTAAVARDWSLPSGLPVEDEKTLRKARVVADGRGLLAYFRDRTLTAAQRSRIRELIPRLGDDVFAVRQQASLELLALGPAALPHLQAARGDPDEEINERLRAVIGGLQKDSRQAVSVAAARLLRARAPSGAAEVLLAYLPEAEDVWVADEVFCTLAVLGVSEGKVAPALMEARKNREPARRAAAALVLGRSGTREQRAQAQELLADRSAQVRFRAAQGLLAGRERTSISALIALVGDGPSELALRADELLRCVAGARAPHLAPGTTPLARRRCQAAWASWWRYSPGVDLHRADVDLPPFNLALRCRQTAWQFAAAYRRGDRDELKKLADFPFLLGGNQTVTQPDELEKQLENTTALSADVTNLGLLPGEWTARNLDTGVRLISAREQAFLARFRRGEIRVVEIATQPATPGAVPESMIVLVRPTAARPRIVGFDASRCLPSLLLSR
jgi:Spy/CpxP family protein refolding chaperone